MIFLSLVPVGFKWHTTPQKSAEVVTQEAQALTLDEKIERLSAKYNVSKSLAKRIIWCESRNNPDAIRKNYALDSSGNSYVWSRDIGYWQLNTYYQKDSMAKLGYDIFKPEQNLEAGFVLLRKEGSTPWNWSKWCWGR